jgi:hypothetical protein
MNISDVTHAIRTFIKRYRIEFENLSSHGTHLLELSGLVVSAEHYRRCGYTTSPENLIAGRFRVKTGARGYPHNFSWFNCTQGSKEFQIHSNLAVAGAYGKDKAIYVVDVAVIKAGAIKTRRQWKKKSCVNNPDLETFLEAKKLVVYPMLIAQFIGIVHEIKPEFLVGKRPTAFRRSNHFDPALISIGHLHGTSASICRALKRRRFYINILPHFDLTLARLRSDPFAPSPFV